MGGRVVLEAEGILLWRWRRECVGEREEVRECEEEDWEHDLSLLCGFADMGMRALRDMESHSERYGKSR